MIQDFYNSTVAVTQESQSKNSMGGVSRSYSTRITSLLCRVTSMDIRRRSAYAESNEFGKMTLRQGLVLYCDASSTNKAIEASDRVTLGTRTFQVKGIDNPGLLDRHLRIEMLEIV
ncbi:hypothetical protein LCGC14_0553520 [marine sediment metagenome]|uniref:Uncharacterized protein n=1 Tax=marine sediment metagenome TaxID=412755 RepID=A0A0F9S7R6_9ZZZZ